MKSRTVVISGMLLGIVIGPACGLTAQSQDRDYVPNEKTAIAIAVAILEPLYGEKIVKELKPYTATAEGDVWIVTGRATIRLDQVRNGGSVVVKISKRDARILSVRLNI